MIPIDARSWETQKHPQTVLRIHSIVEKRVSRRRTLRSVAFLTVALLVTGCTNSKLIIGPLYNRLDDQMRTEFHKLGDFNKSQVQAFEQSVGTFHVWHRQSEMPKYAAFLGEIAQSVGEKGATRQADVDRWADNLEQFFTNFRQCHPINYSTELIRSLSDKQIDFIEQRFNSERKKNQERYAGQTQDERVERRLKNIVKWSDRLGLNLSSAQQDILKDSLAQQVSLRKEYYALSSEWNKHFFLLARNQENPEYHEALLKHISTLWTLLEIAHPEEWQSIRDLWRSTTLTLVSTFSQQQRNFTRKWLSKMAKTIDAISRDHPSFNVSNDPSIGCLVKQNDLSSG
ncbi:MAG: DUF6279 family lipoprotein [Granulosicoccus sp.]